MNYIKDGGDFSRDESDGPQHLVRHPRARHGRASATASPTTASSAPAARRSSSSPTTAAPASASPRSPACPSTYIFTHDSVGVGEDGPTHQPVETVSGLRVIPNLDVIRPGDPEETAAAFAAAFSRNDGPTLLALTRQDVPHQGSVSASRPPRRRAQRRLRPRQGNRRARQPSSSPPAANCSTPSTPPKQLGAGVRVVSMPCFERFDRQPPTTATKSSRRPARKRVAIEAGVTGLWWKYVGTRRQGHRHRPLRHQRPRQHRHEGTRHDGGESVGAVKRPSLSSLRLEFPGTVRTLQGESGIAPSAHRRSLRFGPAGAAAGRTGLRAFRWRGVQPEPAGQLHHGIPERGAALAVDRGGELFLRNAAPAPGGLASSYS